MNARLERTFFPGVTVSIQFLWVNYIDSPQMVVYVANSPPTILFQWWNIIVHPDSKDAICAVEAFAESWGRL